MEPLELEECLTQLRVESVVLVEQLSVRAQVLVWLAFEVALERLESR